MLISTFFCLISFLFCIFLIRDSIGSSADFWKIMVVAFMQLFAVRTGSCNSV